MRFLLQDLEAVAAEIQTGKDRENLLNNLSGLTVGYDERITRIRSALIFLDTAFMKQGGFADAETMLDITGSLLETKQ